MTNENYIFEVINDDLNTDPIKVSWEMLLKTTNSPEPIYQSPGFLSYLFQSSSQEDYAKIVTIKLDNKIIGVVPLRFCKIRLQFNFGKFKLRTPKQFLNGAILLGSLPLAPDSTEILELLYEKIAEIFPDCEIIYHQSVPANSIFFHNLIQSKRINRLFSKSTLHGLRDSHSMPLPPTFEEYEQKYGRKKRYNLNRQIRLLGEACGGALELEAVENPDQVQNLVDAIECISPTEKVSEFLPAEKYRLLAKNKVLLAYILKSNGKICALVAGTVSNNIFQLPLIVTNSNFTQLSPGTSMLHLLVENLIERGVTRVEMGYGKPKYSHSTANEVNQRFQLMLYRKNIKSKLTFLFHGATIKLEKFSKKILLGLKDVKARVSS